MRSRRDSSSGTRTTSSSTFSAAIPSTLFTGFFTGDGIADLLLGWPQTLRLNNVMVAEQLQEVWAGFIQDDWKVSPNFTVNMGLRYEYATPYWAKEPFPNVNLNFETGELIRATDDDRYLVDTDKNNWAPRLGFAYQIKPDRIVARGGYGLFYGGEDFRGSGGNLVLNPPNLLSPAVVPVGNSPPQYKVSDPVPAQLVESWNPADSVRTSIQTRDPSQKAVAINQWNLAVEFLLPYQSTFEVAYVGNRGRNLPGTYQANQTPFGLDGSIPINRPYPMWQTIEKYETVAKSQYHGLQLKFERRLSGGWYNLTLYSYNRAFSETGGFAAGNAPESTTTGAPSGRPTARRRGIASRSRRSTSCPSAATGHGGTTGGRRSISSSAAGRSPASTRGRQAFPCRSAWRRQVSTRAPVSPTTSSTGTAERCVQTSSAIRRPTATTGSHSSTPARIRYRPSIRLAMRRAIPPGVRGTRISI